MIMDAVTPSLDYYRKESEAKADTTYEVWMERRSQHLSECCAMAAMHALEQLEIYRTKQTF